MNKVITINLGGTAHQLEEAGYDALRSYLETATARLQGNPDRDEILSDIEGAIGEKFRALLASHKTVVEAKEVTAVLAEMGPIEADPGKATDPCTSGASTPGNASGPEAAGAERATGQGGPPRRLYRIHEGAMISGVCNGIAAHLNIERTTADDQGTAGHIEDACPHVAEVSVLAGGLAKLDRAAQNIHNAKA